MNSNHFDDSGRNDTTNIRVGSIIRRIFSKLHDYFGIRNRVYCVCSKRSLSMSRKFTANESDCESEKIGVPQKTSKRKILRVFL
jgi:hypothetical protein